MMSAGYLSGHRSDGLTIPYRLHSRMTPEALVREYYAAIDDGDYDTLRDLLVPAFTQERGDRTFDSRGEFVSFMRHDRPRHDTRHDIETIYDGPDGDVAVAGQVVATGEAGADDAGEVLFEFLDVFGIEDAEIVGLRTFADSK